MAVNPQPQVVLDGTAISCAGDNIDTTVTVLRDLAISFGRDSYFAHGAPAVARVRLFDPVRHWAAVATSGEGIGMPCECRWYDEEASAWFVFFRGSVAEIEAEPRTVAMPDGRVIHGWQISLVCNGRDAKLANISIPQEHTWPNESALNRAIRINDYHYQLSEIAQTYFRPTDVDFTMWAPDDPSAANIYEHIKSFYQSMGDSFSYWHDENVLRYTLRYTYGQGIYMAVLPDDGGPRYVILRPAYGTQWYGGEFEARNSALPGNASTAKGPISITRANAINRVQFDWKDHANAYNDWSSVLPASIPNGTDIRTWQATSWLDDGLDLDPRLQTILDRALDEGMVPPHPDIEWDTRITGGFFKWTDARHFTLAAERAHFCYVTGSRYAEWLDRAPIFARLGGRVLFDGTHWKITAHLQWASQQFMHGSANVSWEDLQDRVKWEPYPGWTSTDRFWHPSISYWDTGNITDATQFYTY